MDKGAGDGGTPVKWSDEALRRFYRAFHKHGTNWSKVSKSVGSFKTAAQCEGLYRQHQTFLGLPSQPQLEVAFIAMVTDHVKNLEVDKSGKGGSETVSDDDDSPQTREPEVKSRGKSTPKAEDKDDMGAFSTPNLPPIVSPLPEPTSQKKRARRLFSGDDGDGNDLPQQPTFIERWRERHNDEIGEGVDALLSLASVSHASADMAHGEPCYPTPASKRNAAVDDDIYGDAHDEMNSGKIRSRASVSGAKQLREIMMSSPTSRGSGRSARLASQAIKTTPGKSPRHAARGGSKGTQQDDFGGSPLASAGRPSRRSSRRAPHRRHLDESEDQSTEDGGADADETESFQAVGRTGSALGKRTPSGAAHADQEASQGVASAGKRGNRGGSATANDAQMEGLAQGMVMMAEGLDMYNYDPSQINKLLGFPMDIYPRPLNSLPPLSARLTSDFVRNLPSMGADVEEGDLILPSALFSQPEGRNRRRKPLPEKYSSSLYTPHKSSLHQRSNSGSGFLPGGGLSTPTSAAVAAAAASVLSPTGLGLGSPSFLPGGSGLGLGRLGGGTPPSYLGGKRGSSMANHQLGETGEPQSSPELMLRHSLSLRCRRWCLYEFVYSAVDRPWFIRSELAVLLQHLCGGPGAPVPAKLTRGEWAILRGSFGTPRRLSLAFLKEERIKLEAYREHVRRIYDDFSPRSHIEVPAELARPLAVGQEVTARHPITRQIHDGVILTVKGNKYRVQFNRSELMTQEVADVDLMPMDPHLNLPLAMPSRPMLLNGRTVLSATVDRAAGDRRRKLASTNVGRPMLQQSMKGGDTISEAERQVVAEINSILNQKEALVARLKAMNDDSSAGAHKEENGLHSDQFQLAYSQVILQLKELNSQLEARMPRLQPGSSQYSLAAAALMGDGGRLLQVGAPGSVSPLADVPPGSAVAKPEAASGAFIKPEFSADAAAAAARFPAQGSGLDAGPGAGGAGKDAAGALATAHVDGAGKLLSAIPQGGALGGAGVGSAFTEAEATQLVASALAQARGMVTTCRSTSQETSAATAAAAAATDMATTSPAENPAATEQAAGSDGKGGAIDEAAGAEGDAALKDLITGCVGFLCVLQRATSVDPMLSQPTVDLAVEKGIKLVQPKHQSNMGLYREVENTMRALQDLLAR